MSALAYVLITLAWLGLVAGLAHRAHTRKTSLSVGDIERILLWRCGYMLTTELTAADDDLASRLHAKRLQLRTQRGLRHRQPEDVSGQLSRSAFADSSMADSRRGDGESSRPAPSRVDPKDRPASSLRGRFRRRVVDKRASRR
jgi:hypothetical protein